MTIRRKAVIRVVLAAYAMLLAAVSLVPPSSKGLGECQQLVAPTVQKVLHVAAYAGLTVLIIAAMRSGHIGLGGLTLVFLAAVAYGALLELAQAAIPGRFATLRDVLLNVLGVAAGLLLAAAARRLCPLGRRFVAHCHRGKEEKAIDPITSSNFRVAKVAAILLVATGHFGVGVNLWVLLAVGLFVFAFSSGFFTEAKYAARFDFRGFWNQKLRRLGPEVLVIDVFLLVLFIVQGRSGIWTWQTPVSLVGLTGFLNWFGLPNPSPFGGGLWFFTLLLIFYAVYPALRLLGGPPILLGGISAATLAGAALLVDVAPMGHTLWLTAWAFLFGVVARRLDLSMPPLVSSIAAVVLAAAMVGANVAFGIRQLNTLFIALVSVFAVLWLRRVHLPQKFVAPLHALSGCVLPIYFVHGYLFVRPTGHIVLDLTISLVCIVVVSWLLHLAANVVHWTCAALSASISRDVRGELPRASGERAKEPGGP